MSAELPTEIERLRQMAAGLDCLIEEDFQLLAGTTPGTVEAWRKRRTGPSYIRLGRRYLYPRAAVAEFLQSRLRERPAMVMEGLL